MAGLVRSHDVAPPRANWGFRNSAPEWRWFWRQCAGLWRFDYPDTAYNIATRDVGDAGGEHVGWDGASVATTPFGRGTAAGGGMAVTSPDPGFWHDAIAERTWFGVCVITRSASGSFTVFNEGAPNGAGGASLTYKAAVDQLECAFGPGNAQVDFITPEDPTKLIAFAMTYRDQDNVGSYFVNGHLVGTATTSGNMASHGATPAVWDSSTATDGTLLLFGVATRAWGDGEAMRWTADPFAPLRAWRPVLAAGGTTHALSGTLPLALTLDGSLAVRRALGGALPLALTLDGPIEVRRALGGALSLALQQSGALSTGPAALGDLAVSDAARGGLAATAAAFGGIALVDTAASGDLEVSDG